MPLEKRLGGRGRTRPAPSSVHRGCWREAPGFPCCTKGTPYLVSATVRCGCRSPMYRGLPRGFGACWIKAPRAWFIHPCWSVAGNAPSRNGWPKSVVFPLNHGRPLAHDEPTGGKLQPPFSPAFVWTTGRGLRAKAPKGMAGLAPRFSPSSAFRKRRGCTRPNSKTA